MNSFDSLPAAVSDGRARVLVGEAAGPYRGARCYEVPTVPGENIDAEYVIPGAILVKVTDRAFLEAAGHGSGILGITIQARPVQG